MLYRAQQFWHAVFLKTDLLELTPARDRLTPTQWALFARLQPAEQAHALRMLHTLLARGENQPDLLVAALLHDVGKLQYRLNPLERAMVVIVQVFMPRLAQEWSSIPAIHWEALPGWRKAFILAGQHAAWGAEMAHQAGVSPLAETLIRLHHHQHLQDTTEMESRLIHALRAVDNES
jgi:hypothetical protein